MSDNRVGTQIVGRFDQTYANEAVAALKSKGIVFSDGLELSELKAVEDVVGAKVPPELRLFWQSALPTGDDFPRWREDPEGEAQEFHKWIGRAVRFDVEQNQYWHVSWGLRPSAGAEAVELALREIAKAPPMIRVYSHRHMTTEPVGWGNPVLSVWQMIDSIYYGYDLADYFAREFKIAKPGWSRSRPPRVPFWGDLFDLLSEKPIK